MIVTWSTDLSVFDVQSCVEPGTGTYYKPPGSEMAKCYMWGAGGGGGGGAA